MTFAEKKAAYHSMQDEKHLCCDRELLEKKAPKHPALRSAIVNREKAQREILWALLDHATVEEIKAYRKPVLKTPEELTKLLELINGQAPDTMEGVKEADDLVCALLDTLEKAEFELTGEQKDLVSAYKGLLSAVLTDLRKKDVEKQLLELDLQATTQPKLSTIARSLNIETPNYQKATLIPLLDAYRLNLKKTDEGDGQEKTPIEADLGKVNELEDENESLKDELEEVQILNEDLQEQLENAEAEKDGLQEQLEEEKKSGPETQSPKKKTSIRELGGKILKILTSSEQ